ncbi:SH3 domain-containing protein [Cryptosporidium felis]|nr:SH3 domain-containing protein [Cryptosporidium felis]
MNLAFEKRGLFDDEESGSGFGGGEARGMGGLGKNIIGKSEAEKGNESSSNTFGFGDDLFSGAQSGLNKLGKFENLSDDIEELYRDSIDSKMNELGLYQEETNYDSKVLNAEKNSISVLNKEISEKSDDIRASLHSNDQNSFTDESFFNVNNSFGSNMANYSANDSVHEANCLGPNQKIESRENVLLNRVIDHQGIYSEINLMCENLMSAIRDNFQNQAKEMKDLSDKVCGIEKKLNEFIALLTSRMKTASAHNATHSHPNVMSSQAPDRADFGGDHLDFSQRNVNNQNFGNVKSNQLFSNSNFLQGNSRQNACRDETSKNQNDMPACFNSNFNNAISNSNGIYSRGNPSGGVSRETQREAEKRAEAERLRKLEIERKKREEAERKRIEEEKRKQMEEAERKMKADLKRKEIMSSLFASQTVDSSNGSSDKKPSLFGDETSPSNLKSKGLFDD